MSRTPLEFVRAAETRPRRRKSSPPPKLVPAARIPAAPTRIGGNTTRPAGRVVPSAHPTPLVRAAGTRPSRSRRRNPSLSSTPPKLVPATRIPAAPTRIGGNTTRPTGRVVPSAHPTPLVRAAETRPRHQNSGGTNEDRRQHNPSGGTGGAQRPPHPSRPRRRDPSLTLAPPKPVPLVHAAETRPRHQNSGGTNEDRRQLGSCGGRQGKGRQGKGRQRKGRQRKGRQRKGAERKEAERKGRQRKGAEGTGCPTPGLPNRPSHTEVRHGPEPAVPHVSPYGSHTGVRDCPVTSAPGRRRTDGRGQCRW